MYFIKATMSGQLPSLPITLPPGLYDQASGKFDTAAIDTIGSSPQFSPSTSGSPTFSIPHGLDQIPVIQMIRSGKDEDAIIGSILEDDAQISIDAIDKACFTLACHRKICGLNHVLSIRR